jgi:hypothetical protein
MDRRILLNDVRSTLGAVIAVLILLGFGTKFLQWMGGGLGPALWWWFAVCDFWVLGVARVCEDCPSNQDRDWYVDSDQSGEVFGNRQSLSPFEEAWLAVLCWVRNSIGGTFLTTS